MFGYIADKTKKDLLMQIFGIFYRREEVHNFSEFWIYSISSNRVHKTSKCTAEV